MEERGAVVSGTLLVRHVEATDEHSIALQVIESQTQPGPQFFKLLPRHLLLGFQGCYLLANGKKIFETIVRFIGDDDMQGSGSLDELGS